MPPPLLTQNTSALESNFYVLLQSAEQLSWFLWQFLCSQLHAVSTLQKAVTDCMTPQTSPKQWPGSVLHHSPSACLGTRGTQDQEHLKSFKLGPACSGLGPQMVLDAGAPKCKSINSCNPCILHASVQGTRGKLVLHGKGLFIFPVTRHDVVGDRQTFLCQEKCVI